MGHQFSLIQRLPLTTRPQHIEDGVSTGPVSLAWPTTTEAMSIHMYR
jgi:hypothetical protein